MWQNLDEEEMCYVKTTLIRYDRVGGLLNK